MATVYDVEQQLKVLSGLISDDIHQRTINTSPWLKLVKQDAWQDEMGTTITSVTFERSLPLDESDEYNPQVWTQITSNAGGDSGTCAPTATTLDFPRTEQSWSLYQTAIESPDICLNDLRFATQRQKQLAAIMNILTQNTQYIWTERNRDEYTRLAEHKVLADASLTEDDSAFPLQVPTSGITNGILSRIYMKLIRDGAHTSAMGMENGRPIFTVILSPEASEKLKFEEGVRDDYRYNAGKVNELLAPLGVERSYKGFYHLIDDFAPRWNFTGGQWVRVYPWKGTTANFKKKLVINPAYETAAYEDVIVFCPEVMTVRVPKPLSSQGKMKFDPTTFRGDFQWRNIPDRATNPDGLIGFFRGVFQSASEPVFPQFGYVIRCQRCDIDLDLLSCS